MRHYSCSFAGAFVFFSFLILLSLFLPPPLVTPFIFSFPCYPSLLIFFLSNSFFLSFCLSFCRFFFLSFFFFIYVFLYLFVYLCVYCLLICWFIYYLFIYFRLSFLLSLWLMDSFTYPPIHPSIHSFIQSVSVFIQYILCISVLVVWLTNPHSSTIGDQPDVCA